MSHIFTLLYRLISLGSSRKQFLAEPIAAEQKEEPVQPVPFLVVDREVKNQGGSMAGLHQPMMGWADGRWHHSQVHPEDFGINLPQHLSPVAMQQEGADHNFSSSTQTSSLMKQILLTAGCILRSLFSVDVLKKPEMVRIQSFSPGFLQKAGSGCSSRELQGKNYSSIY